MDPASRPKRPFGLGIFMLVVLATGLIGGLAGAGGAALNDLEGPLGLILTLALMAVTMALAFAACIWWWRGIDEAAREAHKWAWWWGGSGGMAVGAILLLTLTLRDGPPLMAGAAVDAAELIAGGMYAILFFQLAGYSLAWAIWWLKHR